MEGNYLQPLLICIYDCEFIDLDIKPGLQPTPADFTQYAKPKSNKSLLG